MNPITVVKFGGTSLADFDAMARCADIVINNSAVRLVVVSASAGVTNYLVKLASNQPDDNERHAIVEQIAQIEYDIVKRLNSAVAVLEPLEQLLAELKQVAFHEELLNSRAIQDQLLSLGERMSSLLFSELLRQRNASALNLDARKVLKTDSNYGHAQPNIEQIAQQVARYITPNIEQNVLVTQGFIGSDMDGRTTTLGRGGSDYSAALLAEGMNANTLEIWTDVVGIYTTDPRITEQARPIPEISFDEAAEMATFGAKILHPATLIPAMRKDIRVFVGSSRAPHQGGTWIVNKAQNKPAHRAIALRNEQVLVTVKSPEMLHATGFLAQVFSILAKHKMSVDLITTSEISVALTLDNPSNGNTSALNPQAIRELEAFCEVSVERELALIAVVGNHVQQSGSAGLFSVLEQLSPRLICQGASPHNICFLVPQDKAKGAVQQLHDTLFG